MVQRAIGTRRPLAAPHAWLLAGLWLLLFGGLSGCGDSKSNATGDGGDTTATDSAGQAEATPGPQVPKDRYWNDLARFFAGLPPEEGSTLQGIDELPAMEGYRNNLDAQWAAKRERLLDKLRPWAKEQFPEAFASERNVFYPFSGPDFLTVVNLYPDARRYFMFGLEREGPAPGKTWLQNLNRSKLPNDLRNMQISMNDIMGLTFFKTKDMAGDFIRTQFQGATPLLLAFIARTGHRVVHVEQIMIDNKGEVVPHPNPPRKPKAFTPYDSTVTGMRIYFHRDDRPEYIQSVVYVQCDVENKGLAKTPQFVEFMQNLKPASGFIKSASYLLHYGSFTRMKNIFQGACELWLQDDTGCRLQDIDRSEFEITFYGNYVRPIPLFRARYQQDLRDEYTKEGNTRPMPFGMGYTSRPTNTNLQLMRRKQ